jgi:hypothetical protein
MTRLFFTVGSAIKVAPLLLLAKPTGDLWS